MVFSHCSRKFCASRAWAYVLAHLLCYTHMSANTLPRQYSRAHRCCLNETGRLPLFTGGSEPYFTYNNQTGSWSGILLDLLYEAAQDTGMDLSFIPWDEGYVDFHTFTKSDWNALSNATPGDLLLVPLSQYPTLYDTEAPDNFVLTSPLVEIDYTALVRKTKKENHFFAAFDPFEPRLWSAIVGCILCTCAYMVVVSVLKDFEEGKRIRFKASDVARGLYHAFAFWMQGEDYEWSGLPSLCFRLGLLFIVLVFNAAYTANMAAFFTRPDFTVHGPGDVESLKDVSQRICMMFPETKNDFASFIRTEAVLDLPRSLAEARDSGSILRRSAWCHEQLMSGAATVWVDDRPGLMTHLKDNCDTLHHVSSIAILPAKFGLMLPADRGYLARKLTQAFNHQRLQPEYLRKMREVWHVGFECAGRELASATDPISLESMGGVFAIFLSVYALGLVLQLATAFAIKYERVPKCLQVNTAEDATGDFASHRELTRHLFNKMEDIDTRMTAIMDAGGRGSHRVPTKAPRPDISVPPVSGISMLQDPRIYPT